MTYMCVHVRAAWDTTHSRLCLRVFKETKVTTRWQKWMKRRVWIVWDQKAAQQWRTAGHWDLLQEGQRVGHISVLLCGCVGVTSPRSLDYAYQQQHYLLSLRLMSNTVLSVWTASLGRQCFPTIGGKGKEIKISMASAWHEERLPKGENVSWQK